jgi:hypothetical protein
MRSRWQAERSTGILSSRTRHEEDHVNVERSRIRLLTGGAAAMLTLATGIRSWARADALPGITVYKTPT